MTPAPDSRARDAEARRAAQRIFDRPIIVEAGAGTGKTTILVARVLSWSLGPGWDAARTEILELETTRLRRSHKHGVASEPAIEAIAAKTLESVVAITFTEAAAAEMASRAAERLAEVATGRVGAPGFDPELITDAGGRTLDTGLLAERARALLGQLDRLTASTIHAFCHALLRRHPLEARLHPEFAIDARGERLEEIVRLVVEARIKRAYAEESVEESPLLELAAYGKSPPLIAEALREFAFEGVPSTGLESSPFKPEVVSPFVSELQDLAERFLSVADGDLAKIKRAKLPALVGQALEETRSLLAAFDGGAADVPASLQRLCSELATLWDGSHWKRLKEWSRARFGKGEKETLGDRRAVLAELAGDLVQRIAYLRIAQPVFLEVARRALLPLLQEVEREARSAGVVNFQALLREAWSLLREHRNIRERERRGIRQLLVDEFQDTDRLQCDIVELLALPAGDVDHHVGLFIVGDPKQSIYGWRNADLEAYDRLVGLALAAGGERYPLVRNFRSRPAILEEVDRAIAPIMSAEPGLQPPFESLVPSSPGPGGLEAGGRWSPVEYWVSWHPRWRSSTRAAEAAEIEARAIAEDIRALHEAGTEWKDCALLLRSAGKVDTFLDAFRSAGVPFVVTSDKQYFRRREVIDASALVRCVVSPADHTALLTWLRSPIVGVPDAALIPLWARGLPKLLTELESPDQRDRLAELEDVIRDSAACLAQEPAGTFPGLERVRGWEELLIASVKTLAELRLAFRQQPSDRFIEQLRWSFPSEAVEGARYLGRYRVANLERLFRSILMGLESHKGDVRAVLRLLRRSVSLALEAEDALPRDAAEDAVQVMTIHKAKGLEFGHVYLAQLHAEGRGSERQRFDADRRWDGRGQLEYVLFDAPTLGFEAVERHRERVAAAEQVRTLYVALTRAQRRLVLVGKWPESTTAGTAPAQTYIGLLGQRLGHPESVAKLAAASGGLEHGVADGAGVLWRFPGLRETEIRFDPRKANSTLPGPDEVRAAAQRVRTLRADASLGMNRPFLAQASLGEEPDHQITSGSSRRPPYSRQTAMAIGSTIHHVLEAWDFEAELGSEHARQVSLARTHFERLVSSDQFETGWTEIAELLQRLGRGDLLRSLVAAPETILARELPILLPPRGDDATGPIAGISGTIDLVRKDPDGRIVIVDYKTDRVESEDDLRSRALAYAPQLAVYARAIDESLNLDRPAGTELWFLWPDRVWAVDCGDSSRARGS